MTPVRWIVLAAPTLAGGIGAPIGEVLAADRRTARELAETEYGAGVGVEAAMRHDQAKRERLGTGHLPQRQPKREGNRYRDFARAKCEAARPHHAAPDARAPRGPQPLALGLSDARTDEPTAPHIERRSSRRATGETK